MTLTELKKEYQEQLRLYNGFQQKFLKLQQKPVYKKYEEIRTKVINLQKAVQDLDSEVRIQTMRECNHVFINDKRECDNEENHSRIFYPACIKCGLAISCNCHENDLDKVQKEMNQIYNDPNLPTTRKNTRIIIPLDLAMGIYKGIVNKYPNIDDDTMIEYFKAALYNIKEKKATEAVKIKRLIRHNIYSPYDNRSRNIIMQKRS